MKGEGFYRNSILKISFATITGVLQLYSIGINIFTNRGINSKNTSAQIAYSKYLLWKLKPIAFLQACGL